MDSRYRVLTVVIPWTQSIPSCDVNAATRLAEVSWRRDNLLKVHKKFRSGPKIWVDLRTGNQHIFFFALSLKFYCSKMNVKSVISHLVQFLMLPTDEAEIEFSV